MTTRITVQAHCSTDKKVSVAIEDGLGNFTNHYLENSEEQDFYAFDERTISIKEVLKE